uniref:CSON008718 protein n=1 Tax=Culicoides sonorensis TaxID=179676 RepID=A0A336M4J2_CULSO
MEQELSQLSLSEDDLTVKEGELIDQSTSTINDEKSLKTFEFKKKRMVPKSSMDESRQSSNMSYVKNLLKEPTVHKIKLKEKSPIKDSSFLTEIGMPNEDEVYASSKTDSLSKYKFLEPLASYLPQTRPIPALFSDEEESFLNKAFYDNEINVNSSIKSCEISDISVIDARKSDNEGHHRDEMTSNSISSKMSDTDKENVPKQSDFTTAKAALERDIIRLGHAPKTVNQMKTGLQAINEQTPKPIQKVEETPGTKKSYLESFFVREYETPAKQSLNTELNESCPFNASTLSEYQQKLKALQPSVKLASDFLTEKTPTVNGLNFVDFDSFMEVDDDDNPDELLQEKFPNPDCSFSLSEISAKMKRSQSKPMTDQEYYIEVLSQFCDNPVKNLIEFDPEATMMAISQEDRDYDLNENENENEENVKSDDVFNENDIQDKMNDIKSRHGAKKDLENLNPSFFDDDPPKPVKKSFDAPLIQDEKTEKSFFDRNSPKINTVDVEELLKSPQFESKKQINTQDILENFTQYIENIFHDSQPDTFDSEISKNESLQKERESGYNSNSISNKSDFNSNSISNKSDYNSNSISNKSDFNSVTNSTVNKPRKTLGIAHTYKKAVKTSEDPKVKPIPLKPIININYGTVPSQSSKPSIEVPKNVEGPSSKANRVAYQIQSSIPVVDPFKCRQRSVFGRQPARIRNLDHQLAIFKQDYKLQTHTTTIRDILKNNDGNFVTRPQNVNRGRRYRRAEEDINNLEMFRDGKNSIEGSVIFENKQILPSYFQGAVQYFQKISMPNNSVTKNTEKSKQFSWNSVPCQKILRQSKNLLSSPKRRVEDTLAWLDAPPAKSSKFDDFFD